MPVVLAFNRYLRKMIGLCKKSSKESIANRLSTGETFLCTGKLKRCLDKSVVNALLNKAAKQLKKSSPLVLVVELWIH